jgi:uncharacterized membrane protein YedE/YeeE
MTPSRAIRKYSIQWWSMAIGIFMSIFGIGTYLLSRVQAQENRLTTIEVKQKSIEEKVDVIYQFIINKR